MGIDEMLALCDSDSDGEYRTPAREEASSASTAGKFARVNALCTFILFNESAANHLADTGGHAAYCTSFSLARAYCTGRSSRPRMHLFLCE